jgi:hypothetical protein
MTLKYHVCKSWFEGDEIPRIEHQESLEDKLIRYERYLRCSYKHDRTLTGDYFYCTKCGFSESEFKKDT